MPCNALAVLETSRRSLLLQTLRVARLFAAARTRNAAASQRPCSTAAACCKVVFPKTQAVMCSPVTTSRAWWC